MSKIDDWRPSPSTAAPWRVELFDIIFKADTSAGKNFDLVLLWCILLSVSAVLLESVAEIRADHRLTLRIIEWFFTLLFTVEYVLRLGCVRRPREYATSFFGVVDLLAILPAYISLFLPGAQSLMVVRGLRVLRIFRILKLGLYFSEGRRLGRAIWETRYMITVFILAVLTLVLIIGAMMYLIEGEEYGFDSVPRGMYWAIVTLTTVGYGDISPQTPLGQVFASIVMICGYGIIAIPTGIVTVALSQASQQPIDAITPVCPHCKAEDHDIDAKFCKYCGSVL